MREDIVSTGKKQECSNLFSKKEYKRLCHHVTTCIIKLVYFILKFNSTKV